MKRSLRDQTVDFGNVTPLPGARLMLDREMTPGEIAELRARCIEMYKRDGFGAIVLGPPTTWVPILTIDETIARLDAAIANVRRFA